MDKETLFYMSVDTLEDLKPIGSIFDLSGKVAVVTGTLGLALTVIYRLAECGASVVCGARNAQAGNLVEKEMTGRGYQVKFKQTDAGRLEDIRALVAFAEETYGTVDIVVPIAAVWEARAFVDVEEETWDKILDTDLKGQYFLCQAAARSMIRGRKGGKIVAISSVAYRADDMAKMAMMTPYNAAKAGVIGMAQGMAKELKQYGINVNCVAPGGMLTPGAMTNGTAASRLYGPEYDRDLMENGKATPVAANPDEVALMIVAMCTDISNYMYGQVIDVDGGSQFSFQEKPWSFTMEGGLHA